MERKKRTVISIPDVQPELDFAEAEHSPPFTFPEYQRGLIGPRFLAGTTDFGIVGLIYLAFVTITFSQMPPNAVVADKRVLGIYLAGYLLLVAIYYLLFMLSGSQTPGMKLRQLTVVTRDDASLDPRISCLRGFGYFISILPLMLGFVWALVDPEHLTWADKVSGTFVRKT
jgi:uncharacterized RDD family membrane protein YckC